MTTENLTRIAVADDEYDLRDYFRRVLTYLGYNVVAVASNGQELVDLCRKTQPDLIITDLDMPLVDGVQALQQLSQDRPWPVIIVSAHVHEEMVRTTVPEHTLSYLLKPVSRTDLKSSIHQTLERFTEFQLLQGLTENLTQALALRSLVDEAKTRLCYAEQLTPAQAFARIQQTARESGEELPQTVLRLLKESHPCQCQLPPPEPPPQ